MLPHSYTLDSHSKSQGLTSAIISASSPSQILHVCASVDSFLHSHSPDHYRHFFSLTFPTLICKLFAFDGVAPSNGWIELASSSNYPDFASRLFEFLSPSSVLFNSIAAVDRLSQVKYVFPIERLPEWTRFLLQNERDSRALADLCPLFSGRLKEDTIKASSYQLQLNVFEYFMFWFVYYPVCRGSSCCCDNSSLGLIKKSGKFRIENWTHSIPILSSKRGVEQKTDSNLYLRLLYAYLKAYVPSHELNAQQPYRSSLLHHVTGYDDYGSVVVRAEFLLNTLVQFWLVDNDFSPLPINMCKSFAVSFPLRSVSGESPPVPGLAEVVKILVKYLNSSSLVVREGFENVECNVSPRWRLSGQVESVKLRDMGLGLHCVRISGSWNLMIQRPLYRFIVRTFLFCPMGTSIKNASQVFSVWMSYLEPWLVSLDDFAALDGVVDGSQNDVRNENGNSNEVYGYSSSWQSYVLSNYLYYSSLVMHFIGFVHKFLHNEPEEIVQMVLKVVNVLTSSKELTDLLRSVHSVFHSKVPVPGKPLANIINRFVPLIREQLQDWEQGLCESDADGSFLHENWNNDLRLFSDGEDSGHYLLQLFILRAEAEIQAISGNNVANELQCLNSLKEKVAYLFGGDLVNSSHERHEVRQPQQTRHEIFKPRRGGNYALATNIEYKGDRMKRPVCDDEVAWLAMLLIRISDWLNETLGLNHEECSRTESTWSFVDTSGDVNSHVSCANETLKVLLHAIGSGLFMVGVAIVSLMRKHGVRINLRILASKKLVMVFLVFLVSCVFHRAFGLIFTM